MLDPRARLLGGLAPAAIIKGTSKAALFESIFFQFSSYVGLYIDFNLSYLI